MMWECSGCHRLFERDAHDAQWIHALVIHGSVDAVTFIARSDAELEARASG